MSGKRISDENNRSDRDPLTNHADFKELDFSFRKRLDAMVPEDLAKRIQKIMERRKLEYGDGDEDQSEAI